MASTLITAKRQARAISPLQWLTLLVIAAFVIVPFYTTALGGFKEIGELRVNPFGLPASWDPVRFVEILVGPTLFPLAVATRCSSPSAPWCCRRCSPR